MLTGIILKKIQTRSKSHSPYGKRSSAQCKLQFLCFSLQIRPSTRLKTRCLRETGMTSAEVESFPQNLLFQHGLIVYIKSKIPIYNKLIIRTGAG